MRRIEAIIQPHKLGKVVTALHALPDFPGFTVFDAHGQGHGRGKGGVFAYNNKDGLLYHRRQVLVILCEESSVASMVASIAAAAHTGQQGDGLIAVTEVQTCVRIGNVEARP